MAIAREFSTPKLLRSAERFHLAYAGNRAVDLSDGPQILEVNLVRASGAPALLGEYLVDVKPEYGALSWGPHFVQDGRQYFPIESLGVIQPGDILGTSPWTST